MGQNGPRRREKSWGRICCQIIENQRVKDYSFEVPLESSRGEKEEVIRNRGKRTVWWQYCHRKRQWSQEIKWGKRNQKVH